MKEETEMRSTAHVHRGNRSSSILQRVMHLSNIYLVENMYYFCIKS